jgi:hypothetical protein
MGAPSIKDITTGRVQIHLFTRIHAKIKSKTQPFVYCGELKYFEFDKKTSKPVHLIFEAGQFDELTENESLLKIYQWRPKFSGMERSQKNAFTSKVSEKRKRIFKKPNETERRGLITSRVGQGYYRQEILEKWSGKCPVTGCNIQEILISSHIVSWSESDDQERLDPENGILLSPNVDALFDRHLISFSDEGNIIISRKLNKELLKQLGLIETVNINITPGMGRAGVPKMTRDGSKSGR